MARPLQIQVNGAIYHVMARGNGRQLLFHTDEDYQGMLDGLEMTVARTGWEVFAFVWMPNHIHLFFRTPQPNLSRGMQYLLSGYANWYAKRHDRPGHQPDQVPQLRRIALTPQEVLHVVASFYDEEVLRYSPGRSKKPWPRHGSLFGSSPHDGEVSRTGWAIWFISSG